MSRQAYSKSQKKRALGEGAKDVLTRLAPWLLIGGLVIFHATNNWIWLVKNVTWAGWDKPRHLAHSLNYAQMLSPLNIQSLFEVMVSDPIRPPLFPTSAAIMYALFGRTADVATMINVVYMAIALAATYGIGRHWAGRRLGLTSVLLLAFFPMFYAMSRHFYLEFALMAMVALTVYLAIASEGFKKRGVSLLFGLSLGLGLLTKRTFAVFVVGPVLVAMLSAGLLPALWQRIKHRPVLHWKSLLAAVLGGLLVAGLWYLPNRETAQTLILGDSLFFLWWALAGLTIYFATLPSAPLANALSSVFLAAGLASTWYLARIEFVQRVALYGYGINDPRGRILHLDQLDTYLFYLRKLGNEHLSFAMLAMGLFVLVVGTVAFVKRQGSVRQALLRIRPEGWIVATWLVGAYILLTFSIYHETRAFTPALPAVALLIAAALLKWPWRWVRRAALALALVFGLLQFLVLTYEPINQYLPPVTVRLPGWGPTTTFAQGVFIQLPDDGQTDRGYWIAPDILERMETDRLAVGQEMASLGLLVNTSQINSGPFTYQILTEYPNLRVESLLDGADQDSTYSRIFAHDYVAVTRANENTNPSEQEFIDGLLDNPLPLFAQTFELAHTYDLPNGETVFLYRQRYRLPTDYPTEYVSDLAKDLSDRTRPGDAILLAPSQLAGPFLVHYSGPAEVYLEPESKPEVVDIAAQHHRLFLVLGDASTGEIHGLAQDWLTRTGFRAAHEWADSLQVLIYGTVAGLPAATPGFSVGATLADQIELVGYDMPEATRNPGDILPLSLFWQRQTPVESDYNVFVHLVDGDGNLVAQTDSVPVSSSRPTSTWREGEILVDRHGVLLPDDLAQGSYQLLVGMYLPSSGERLLVRGMNGEILGDAIELNRITVGSP